MAKNSSFSGATCFLLLHPAWRHQLQVVSEWRGIIQSTPKRRREISFLPLRNCPAFVWIPTPLVYWGIQTNLSFQLASVSTSSKVSTPKGLTFMSCFPQNHFWLSTRHYCPEEVRRIKIMVSFIQFILYFSSASLAIISWWPRSMSGKNTRTRQSTVLSS